MRFVPLVALFALVIASTSSAQASRARVRSQNEFPRPTVPGLPSIPVPSTPSSHHALVGGNDNCATPDLIVGTGTFAFDNTLATTGTQGQTEALCNQSGGGTTIINDVWFTWTATATGVARVNTCGLTTIDTKIAIYTGSTCPAAGSAIACNDDACATYQSTVLWPCTSGSHYLIQIGNYPGQFPPASPGAGVFEVAVLTPPSNDNCSTPIALAGYGVTAYDDTAASTGTQGQAEALCNFFGGTAIQNDLWYAWTAPFTTTAGVRTCGSTLDTKIAVYSGSGCPSAAAIACNDDFCGVASLVSFPAVAGAVYTIQVGLYQGTNTGGASSFEILDVSPPANDNCSAPVAVSGAGPFAYDTSLSTTGAEGQAQAICSFYGSTAIANDVWFAWTPTRTGTATLTTCGGTGVGASEDTKIAVYDGAGCPTSAAIACNDDDLVCGTFGYPSTVTFNTQCGHVYAVQIGRDPYETNAVYGTFSVVESGSFCTPPSVSYCFGDGSGTACPCGNAGTSGNGCASSINAGGAHLAASGNASIAGDTLVLFGTSMPNASCLYFQGTARANGGLGSLFGDGLRCATGSVHRLGTKTNAGGASQYPAGGDLSISVKGAVTTAGPKDYQCWYRNAAAFCTPSTFNLSNGIEVNWGP